MVVKQAAARANSQGRPKAFESGGAIPKERLSAMLAKYDANSDGQIVRSELKVIMQVRGSLHPQHQQRRGRLCLKCVFSSAQVATSCLQRVWLRHQLTGTSWVRHVRLRKKLLQVLVLVREDLWIMRIRFRYLHTLVLLCREPTVPVRHHCSGTREGGKRRFTRR